MRILISVLVLMVMGVAVAQRPMVKAGPGGSSIVEVVCDDAFRAVDPVTRAEMVQQFRTNIIVRCVARAVTGSGRVQPSEFSYKNRYTSDERVRSLSLSDFTAGYGEVYGGVEREFFIRLPNQERPWVIMLYFAGDATQIVFRTDR